jgi:hypothetical protein
MPKAKKNRSNMGLLVDAVGDDPGLLTLLQESHLPEHQEDLSSQLNQHFAKISGRQNNNSKEIYSNFLGFLGRYGTSISGQWITLIWLAVGIQRICLLL